MTGQELVNRDVIVAELDVLRALVSGRDGSVERTALVSARQQLGRPSTLDEIESGFGLTGFERSVLLLASGPELVGEVSRELQDHTGMSRVSFGSALASLPDPHWNALTPSGPLRRWELVRILDPDAIAASPLVVDERILHHLVGAGHLDERLAHISQPLEAPAWLPRPFAALAERVNEAWTGGSPVLLAGPQPANLSAISAGAAARVGLEMRQIGGRDLPLGALELASTVHRMVRETVLTGCAWSIDLSDGPRPESTLGRALLTCDAPVVLVTTDRRPLTLPGVVALDVPRLSVAERREAYGSALRRRDLSPSTEEVDAVSGIFDLAVSDIEGAADDLDGGAALWDACLRRHRSDLGSLAVVREPRVTWSDLVIPDAQHAQLRALVAAVRHRARVLDEWGFGRRFSRGLGTAVLFAGASGTGKTMAAEVIAYELGLHLVQVDLSQVVSKYIGETEKQLARLFDAAEDGGAVLLFDEADTLFGKRTEIRDSHDRYANLEVGYLLQRMEAFGGLVILTTNARGSLDQAFTRRLSSIVTFPYPDRESRCRMWEGMFPAEAPLEDFRPRRLAEADLAGGGIASAALQASYLAAADASPITMDHLAQAVRWELAKSGRSAASQSKTARLG